MTDIDLTEAVEAAARAMYDGRLPQACDFDALTDLQRHAYRTVVTPIVAACAPILQAQALEAAADEWTQGALVDPPKLADTVSSCAAYTCDWLRARAAEIRGHE